MLFNKEEAAAFRKIFHELIVEPDPDYEELYKELRDAVIEWWEQHKSKTIRCYRAQCGKDWPLYTDTPEFVTIATRKREGGEK